MEHKVFRRLLLVVALRGMDNRCESARTEAGDESKPTTRMWRLVVLPALALALNGAYATVATEELLEPEKAFRMSTRVLDERNVEVRFDIADGYYMYRERFKFETPSGTVLAGADIPRGVRTKDEFFGETQIHRREVVIRVPVPEDAVERGRVRLKVTSQGCSDQGICYVPLEQIAEVKLTATASAPSSRRLWIYVLLGAGVLALLALTYRLAPRLSRSPEIAGMMRGPRVLLGFALAALLLWATTPLLTQRLTDLAWGALLTIAAMWLRAIDPLPAFASGLDRFGKALGLSALAAGMILLLFAAGGRDMLATKREPLTARPSAAAPHFERIAALGEALPMSQMVPLLDAAAPRRKR